MLDTGDRISAQEVRTLYQGHEVSAHTLTHPTIERCPNEQIVHEVMEDRKRLEKLVGYTVRGMSYPNGSYSDRVKRILPGLGIEYSRIVGDSMQFGLPDDWLEWKATCHHNSGLMELAERFAALNKTQYLYLMYVWGHSYEFDRDSNWELFERFCQLAGGRNDIWYATNIEIADYMRAYELLKFSADLSFVYNPAATSVWLSVDGRVVEARSGGHTELEEKA